jgi:uncharacterized protein (UPF0548 family)
MFLARRPSTNAIERFLRDSEQLPLSYGPIGIVTEKSAAGRPVDEQLVQIGRGSGDFERARNALIAWRQFDIGWVELSPRQPPIVVGTTVALLIRHFGFWSLNACRIVYTVGSLSDIRFGFAYGTLTNHAESGEELFDVFVDDASGAVMYRIRATSSPQAVLARVGQPFARRMQARFRRDSGVAMKVLIAADERGR